MKRYPDLHGKAIFFLLFLWFIWFSNFSIRIVFAPILPLIEDEFVIKHAQASSVFIFLSVGYACAVLSSGLFSGKIGHKKSIIISLLLLSMISFLVPIVHKFFLLYLFAFMIGFFVGFYLPSAITLITEYYSEKDWGKTISIHDTGASTAILATPIVAVFLLHFFQWRGIFTVYACAYLFTAIVFCFASDEVKITNPPKAVFSKIIKIKSLWIMAIIWIFGASANLGIYSIIPLYLTKELLLDIDYANTLLGISRVGAVFVAIAYGFLIDRFNLRKIMFFIIITSGTFTVLLGMVSVKYIGIILFLQAFFITGFFPVGLVAIAKTFSREMRSMATGIILAQSITIGGGLTPYLLGLSGDLHSFRLGLVILGVFVVISGTQIHRLKELE